MPPRGSPLEMWKFGVYLVMPVVTIMVFNQPEMITRLIEHKEYIVYPPEAERPPVGGKEQIAEFIKKQREKNKADAK